MRRPGGTLDFQGHRPYSPGDDLRWIDWNALGRVDQAVVKIFSREEEQTVDILVDATASMKAGQPTKLDAARRLAAALGFLALHSRHRLRVGCLGGSRIALHGPFLGLETVPVFFSVLENLDSLVKTRDPRSKPILTTQAVDAQHGVSHGAGPLDEKGGSYEGINLVPAVAGEAEGGLRDYLSRVRHPGAVVVLSDGLEGETLAACLAHLGDVASESSFFHVLCPEEIRPELTGAYGLTDCESEAVLDIEVDSAVLRRYRAELERFREDYRDLCRRHSIRYHSVCSEATVEDVVMDWHHAGGRR